MYELILTQNQPVVDGQPALGSCDPVEQKIEVWSKLTPERRLTVGWHEIAHAWRDAMDIRPDLMLDDEAYAHLIGRAMAAMDVQLVARLHVYLTRGIDAAHVLMYPGHDAVPVLRITTD